MSLQSLRIRNFKAVVDSKTVKLGPLTAFIGNNGAGKSSLIEALETYQAIVRDMAIKAGIAGTARETQIGEQIAQSALASGMGRNAPGRSWRKASQSGWSMTTSWCALAAPPACAAPATTWCRRLMARKRWQCSTRPAPST